MLRSPAGRAEHLEVSRSRARGPVFVVTTQLGVERFDDRRRARTQLAAVVAEVKRMRSTDSRVRSVALRRERGSGSYRLDLGVVAPSAWQAFEIGGAVVRAAIHAAGGSTADWASIQPRLHTAAGGRWELPPRPASWAEADAQAARLLAAMPRLAPMAYDAWGPDHRSAGTTAVIDLR